MIYAMSDIHDFFDKYQAMLSEIQFKSTDALYILGMSSTGGRTASKFYRI